MTRAEECSCVWENGCNFLFKSWIICTQPSIHHLLEGEHHFQASSIHISLLRIISWWSQKTNILQWFWLLLFLQALITIIFDLPYFIVWQRVFDHQLHHYVITMSALKDTGWSCMWMDIRSCGTCRRMCFIHLLQFFNGTTAHCLLRRSEPVVFKGQQWPFCTAAYITINHIAAGLLSPVSDWLWAIQQHHSHHAPRYRADVPDLYKKEVAVGWRNAVTLNAPWVSGSGQTAHIKNTHHSFSCYVTEKLEITILITSGSKLAWTEN